MAVAIRSPAGGYPAGYPNRTIVGHSSPVAVVVEILVTNDIGRNVTSGGSTILALIAFTAPAIKLIVSTDAVGVGNELVSPSESCALIRMDGEGLTTARDFALTASDRDDRRISCFINLHTVVTWSKKSEGQIRRVQFDRLVLVETTQVNTDDAFAEACLCKVVRQIQKREASSLGQMNHCGSQLNFSSGAPVSPEPVTRSDWPIHDRRNPILDSRRLEGNRTTCVRQTCCAVGWVIVIGRR